MYICGALIIIFGAFTTWGNIYLAERERSRAAKNHPEHTESLNAAKDNGSNRQNQNTLGDNSILRVEPFNGAGHLDVIDGKNTKEMYDIQSGAWGGSFGYGPNIGSQSFLAVRPNGIFTERTIHIIVSLNLVALLGLGVFHWRVFSWAKRKLSDGRGSAVRSNASLGAAPQGAANSGGSGNGGAEHPERSEGQGANPTFTAQGRREDCECGAKPSPNAGEKFCRWCGKAK